jgi:predicted NBD/HSP70 family sugar kinase
MARRWAQGDGTAESLFSAAAAGEIAAQRAIDEGAAATARAIQLLIMTYDVEKVVLGGGVLNAGEAFVGPVNAALDEMRARSDLARWMLAPEKIVAAPPHADVARWGAVLLATMALGKPGALPG